MLDTTDLIVALVGLLVAGGVGAAVAWALRRSGDEARRLGREVVRLEEAVRTLHATTANLHDRVLVMETRAASETHEGPNQMSVDSNACNISVRAGPGGTPIGVSVSGDSPGFPGE
jgi:hypothetical protein